MNSVILMGRITKDPEEKTLPSGTFLVQFNIAVDRATKTGEEKKTDFIPCIAFNKTAEMVSKWFGKGKLIAIEGQIQINSYTNNSGKNKTYANVLVNRVHFTGEKHDSANTSAPPAVQNDMDFVNMGYTDDDLPF